MATSRATARKSALKTEDLSRLSRIQPGRAEVRIVFEILVILMLAGLWQVWLLYWVLPLFTFLKAILRIRSIADHFATASNHAYARTRTVLGRAWDRLLIGPCSIGMHGVRHIYPSIPYYRLREAHALMM